MKPKMLVLLAAAAVLMLACGLSLPGRATPTPITVEIPTIEVPTVEIPTVEIPTVEIPTVEIPTIVVELPTEAPTNTPEPTTEAPPVSGDPETYLADEYTDPSSQTWILELISDESLEGAEYRDGRLYVYTNFSTEDSFGISQVSYLNLPQDYAATVDIEFATGSSDIGEAGMVFRVGTDYQDYEFTITPVGEYAIFKYADNEFQALVDYTESDLLKTGPGAVNQLTVLANGDNLTFIINGVTIEELVDDDVQGSDFGLVVYNFDDQGTSAYFDNLLITNLAAYQESPPPLP